MTTKHGSSSLLAVATAIALGASPALAQQTTAKQETQAKHTMQAKHETAKHETQEELQAQAKVSMETARATALARVKDGTVKSEELEREHGRLVYSFDITQPKRSGVDEVNVDAMTGKVVGKVEHESAAKEKAEAKREGMRKP